MASADKSKESVQGVRVLVTGAAGFIGFHLSRALLQAGAAVTGVDNFNDYYDPALKRARLALLTAEPRFDFCQLDISDGPATLALFDHARADIVVHLAAQAGVRYSILNPRAYTNTNIEGFLSILEGCRAHPVRHLIYASSSSVYGANAKAPFHEDDTINEPVSLYAATKRANELMAQAYAHLYRIPTSGLRFFTVYGPWGRPDMAYYAFARSILSGRPIDVFNHGQMQRDFTYVDDVIEAMMRLLDLPPDRAAEAAGLNPSAPHIIYNIGNHTPVALGDFIATLEAAIGLTAEKRYVPMQAGEVLATAADVERLSRVTGFQPTTRIDDGLKRFAEWFLAYHAAG